MINIDSISEYEYSIFTNLIFSFGGGSLRSSEYYNGEFLSSISDSMISQLITKVFNESSLVFADSSDDKVAESLRFIIDPGKSELLCRAVRSNDMAILFSLIDSIFSVYEGVFSKRCLKKLGHDDSVDLEEINAICYMWWDIIPIRFDVSDHENYKEINSYVISLLGKILKLDHVACIESALHGLGHWYFTIPSKVEKIITDQWDCIPSSLRGYAMRAKRGDVV